MNLKKRGRGRPRLPEAKRERITVRVTADTKSALQACAKARGLSVPSLIDKVFQQAFRDAVREAVNAQRTETAV